VARPVVVNPVQALPGNPVVAWRRTYAGGWPRFAKEHGIPYDDPPGGSAYASQVPASAREWARGDQILQVRVVPTADHNLVVAWRRTYAGGWPRFAKEHGIPYGNPSRGSVPSS
jgi:hypothetical protein